MVPEAGSNSPEERRTRRALIDESIFALEAGEVVAKARSLTPAERYEFLAAWVLPAPDRPVWRLSGDLSPSFRAPSCGPNTAQTNKPPATTTAAASGPKRLETGGEIQAPALDLVMTAQATGKLDSLAEMVQKLKPGNGTESPEFERCRLAMLGLIQVARGDDEGVLKTIAAIEVPLKHQPPTSPVHARWPELLLASRALERQALRVRAAALLDILVDQTRKRARPDGRFQSDSAVWDQILTHERARVQLLALNDKDKGEGRTPPVAGLAPAGWSFVSHSKAKTRGQGLPLAQWDTRDGEFMHHPGHEIDMMYLNVPLRGDFQLDCELSSMFGRRLRVMYGGVGVNPLEDSKKLERFVIGRPPSEVALNPPLVKLGDWCAFKLVVKDHRMTAFLNGRQVHDAPVPDDADPWLALLCRGKETGAAQDYDHRKSAHPRKAQALGPSRADRLVE